MSKTKDLKRARRAAQEQIQVQPQPQATMSAEELGVHTIAAPAPRAGFSITIVWDPKTPERTRYNLTVFGEGMPRDGDILTALQITRDDVLVNSVLGLAQQQAAAAQNGSAPNGK
jgi:hypothetical protein